MIITNFPIQVTPPWFMKILKLHFLNTLALKQGQDTSKTQRNEEKEVTCGKTPSTESSNWSFVNLPVCIPSVYSHGSTGEEKKRKYDYKG